MGDRAAPAPVPSPARGTCRLAMACLVGLFLGIAGGSLGCPVAASRGGSNLGAGDIGRDGGAPWEVSPGFVRFSNLARSEETGFWAKRTAC